MSFPPLDGDCCRRAKELGVTKKVFVRRKQQEAIEVVNKVFVEIELRGEGGGQQKEAAGSSRKL